MFVESYKKLSIHTLLLSLLLLSVYGICFGPSASAAFTEFEQTSRSNFNDIPSRLPSDNKSNAANPNDHSYFVLTSTGSIDNQAGSRPEEVFIPCGLSGCLDIGGFNTARIVLYTTNPDISNPNLYIGFVSRAVNFTGNAEEAMSSCNGELMATYQRISGGVSETARNTVAPNAERNSCSTKPLALSGNGSPAWQEIMERDNPSVPNSYKGRKVYALEVRIHLSKTNGDKQSSFSVHVNNNDLRLGYAANAWNNIYGSALDNQIHELNFKWRAPCRVAGATAFTFDDGQEGQFVQNIDAVGKVYRNGVYEAPSIDNFTTGYRVTDDNDSTNGTAQNVRVKFENVKGGNGIGFKMTTDSGRFYFKTCPRSPTDPPPVPISGDCNFNISRNGLSQWSHHNFEVKTHFDSSGVWLANSGNLAAGSTWSLPQDLKDRLRNGQLYFIVHVWNYDSKGNVKDYDQVPGGSTASPVQDRDEWINLSGCNPSVGARATCTAVTVAPNDPNEDNGGNMRVRVTVFARKDKGGNSGTALSQTEHTVDQGGETDIPIYVVPPQNGNYGIFVQVDVLDVYENGSWGGGGDWRVGPSGGSALERGACYTATCSFSVASNIPGGSKGQVMAGSTVEVTATIFNTGDSDNSPLYDVVGSEQLTISSGGGSFKFGQLDMLGSGESIPIGGGSKSIKFNITAPTTRGTYTLDGYPDYYGRFAITESPSNENSVQHCTGDTSVTTYQPYQINPQANITETAPDTENPNYIKYSYNATRSTGEYSTPGVSWYEGGIDSYTQTKLYYVPVGGVEKGPSFYAYDSPAPVNFGNTTTSAQFGDWTDSIVDYRQFNHGGVTDTWNRGDAYCPYYRVQNGFGWIGPSGVQILTEPRVTSGGCGLVTDRPFVRIYGNDSFVGGRFPNGNPGRGVAMGYSRGEEAGAAYAGSGVEFAILATGKVGQNLTSASLRTSLPASPRGLTFANDTVTDGFYGSGFGSDSLQIPDWFESTRMPETKQVASPGAVTASTLTDGQTWYNGNLSLAADTNYSGRHTIYVNGDVTITGDIAYTAGGRTEVSKIPSLVIVAKGNIYVNPNVARMDGIYVAQPKDSGSGKNNDTATGRIYTCRTGDSPNTAAFAATCGQYKLQVNGALIAQDVRFLRTKGTLKDVEVTQQSKPPVPAVPAVPGIPTVPAVPAFKGLDNVGWTAIAANVNAGTQTSTDGRKCLKVYEPWDHNWTYEWDRNDSDNYLCYSSNYTLSWSYAGALGGMECVSLNNPYENSYLGWHDNYICAPSGSDLGLEMVWNNAGYTPTGKNCVSLAEDDWAPQNANSRTYAWATGKARLCFKPSRSAIPAVPGKPGVAEVPGIPRVPVKYRQETFNGPYTDHAAESIRMTPEVFLAQHALQPINSQSNGKFDYIQSLAPIL